LHVPKTFRRWDARPRTYSRYGSKNDTRKPASFCVQFQTKRYSVLFRRRFAIFEATKMIRPSRRLAEGVRRAHGVGEGRGRGVFQQTGHKGENRDGWGRHAPKGTEVIRLNTRSPTGRELREPAARQNDRHDSDMLGKNPKPGSLVPLGTKWQKTGQK